MNVYISVDMEGIAGVVHEDQTNPVDPRCAGEYARFRRLMTGEANAAIEGALAAGAGRIWVNDSHWFMRNLLAEELHEAAELISGDPKPRSMMEGIDAGFDAAFFIGYHARSRTRNAVLDHTYTDRVSEARVNGRPLGELGLNAALAGTFGVPVVLVSGDSALAAEATELLGSGVTAIVVKQAVSRHAARSIAPAVARQRIRDAASRSLQAKPAPFVIPPPFTMEVDFTMTVQADMAELLPGSTRLSARTVSYRHDDYRELFRGWRAMYNLASVAG
jgi:D-amino peptidase